MNDDQVDYLEVLREFQDGAKKERPMTFSEWSAEQDSRFNKAGSRVSPGYNPGLGMIGHLNTSSNAPAGPRNRPSGYPGMGLKQTPQQFGVPSGVRANSQGQSQYERQRPDQPPPWIDDVNMSSIWYSPFQPVWPFGPPYYTRPREWNYPVGWNLNYVPERMGLFGTLRGMRSSWGVLSTVIETRKDQLLRLPWTIQRRDKPRGTSKGVDFARKFFRKPDGKLSYGQWSRKVLDDLFVLDAPCLFIDRGVGIDGSVKAVECLDGATIFPLIDDAGRRPDTEYDIDQNGITYLRRQPAFQQIIYGLPMIDLSEDELIYAMMRPLPDMPMFGFSPVQQIMNETVEAIRKTFYQLEFWRCYDDKTEVLTRLGWKKWSDVTMEDEFATRNIDNKKFEWQQPTSLFRKEYNGEMIQLSGQRIDLLVTPQHRVLLSGLPRALGGHTWRKGEIFVQANQLIGASLRNCGVPTTSLWEGEEIEDIEFGDNGLEEAKDRDLAIKIRREEGQTLEEIASATGLSFQTISETLKAQESGWERTKSRAGGATTVKMTGDQFCAFMGMWLSEGWVHNEKIVAIAQQRSSKGFAPFAELLSDILGGEPYYSGNGWEFGSVHLAKYLLQFGHAIDKFVPDEIMNATPDQIRIFFHFYYLGDGAEQTKIMYTSSKRMADQFIELAQKMGRNASMNADNRIGKIVKEGQPYTTKNISYGVRIYEFGEYTKGFDVYSVNNFSGYVSCATVPNGTLLVRRNNKTVWSGNSGSMPELIVTVPDAWTPRQIATFQAHFDALLSGQLSLKSKVRFVPGGMKPFDIKNASGESLWSQRDELLVRLCCYAFSVSPTPFVRQMNRSTAQNAQQSAQEEGLYPLMSWWKDDIMDRLIQDVFGFDDIEFVYLPRPEVDLEKQAKIHQVQVDEGIRNRNEIREELGQEPIAGGDVFTVKTNAGTVPLEMILSGDALANKPAPGGGTSNAKPAQPSPQGMPQRGPARPNEASPQPTPVHKLADRLSKVSNKDVRHAAAESEGDIDRVSHLKQRIGNYKKGHIWIQGLNISIENEKGSYRGEKDQKGKKWQVKMPTAYGYIRGTLGADGMQVDVYIGKHPDSTTVWVIDQDKVTPEGKNVGFDEHKVMLGYKSDKKAIKDWMKSHFEDYSHDKLFAVTEISIIDFKAWLRHGDMKEPISEQGVGKVVLRQEDLGKADTISTSTNLSWYSQPKVAKKTRKRKKKLTSGPRWLQLGAD